MFKAHSHAIEVELKTKIGDTHVVQIVLEGHMAQFGMNFEHKGQTGTLF